MATAKTKPPEVIQDPSAPENPASENPVTEQAPDPDNEKPKDTLINGAKAEKPKKLPAANYKSNPGPYRLDIRVIVPKDHTIDDLLVPEYWSFVADQFGDHTKLLFPRIEAIADDKSWTADLVVVHSDRTHMQCAVLMFTDLNIAKIEIPKEYRIEWTGEQNKFAVVRVSDNHMISNGWSSAGQAEKECSDYVKALRR